MGSLRSLRRKERPEPAPPPIPTDEELIKAIHFGTIKNVKALLELGANPNAVNESSTPAIHLAVYYCKLGMTQILEKHGADVNQTDSNQKTALEEAISSWRWYRAEKIALFLLDHGADVNAVGKNGRTTLMHAIIHKRFDLARLLVERGADPKHRNRDGRMAVDFLHHNQGSETLRKMLEQIS